MDPKIQRKNCLFFQDETWTNQNAAPSKTWKDGTSGTKVKTSSGVGARCIISHIGSCDTGLLDGCLLLFRGQTSKKNSDYHTEMNTAVFLDWLEKNVFPRIQKVSSDLNGEAVCVFDRATYQTSLTSSTKPVRVGMAKQEIAEKILMWGGPADDWPLVGWERSVLKTSLFAHAKRM